MKKILNIIFIILSILLILTACGSDKHSPQNQTILYNLKNEPKTLDPQVADDPSAEIIDFNIFEGLTRLDKDNNVIPGVAERWESNDNNTSFTFYLRQNAVWSDKEKSPVTAHDFIFALQRAAAGQIQSTMIDSLFHIKNFRAINEGKINITHLGISAIDDYTLKIDLENPCEDFPRIMSNLCTMPCHKEFFDGTNAQYGLESNTIISNGPFKIRPRYGWDHGKSLMLVRNEEYNGSNKAIPAAVSFSIGKDVSNIIDCIENEIVDAGELEEQYLEQAIKLKYNITSFEDTTWGLSFNFTDDIFKNLNMRKAFVQILNREKTLSCIQSGTNIANDILTDTMMLNGKSYREQAGRNFYLPQLNSVDDLLNKGMKELGIKNLPNITITCLNDNIAKSIANNILETWNNLTNLYFNVEPISAGKLSDKIQIGGFQVIIAPLYANSNNPLDVLSTFKTNAVDNICDMKSNDYDKLVDSMEISYGDNKLNYCIQAEKYLNNNAAFYPLYYTKRYFTTSSKVRGIVFYESSNFVSFINAVKIKK